MFTYEFFEACVVKNVGVAGYVEDFFLCYQGKLVGEDGSYLMDDVLVSNAFAVAKDTNFPI